MSFIARLVINLRDVRSFGPLFLLRHLSRFKKSSTISVRVPGHGAIHVRPGESDVASIRQVFRDKGYDIGGHAAQRIWKRYSDILDSGKVPVIVDAGANIGAASLWFLQKYPAAEIVAIEPEPGNLAILHLNSQEKSRLQVMPAAVGATKGYVSVSKGRFGWAARTSIAESGIPIITMEEAFGSVKNGCPFVAKIDIEGFESDLFSKNTDWLDGVFAVFIEPHDWMLPGQMTSKSFQREFGKRDFEIFISGETLAFVRI